MIESRPFDRQLEITGCLSHLDDESMGRTVRSRNIPQKEWGRRLVQPRETESWLAAARPTLYTRVGECRK